MFAQPDVVGDYERHLELFQTSLRQFASDECQIVARIEKKGKTIVS